jgi:receptor expression-enhancing protein 5/6
MAWLWAIVLRSYALSGPVMMLLYPLYASIMAIESPYKEDDQQWLTYWVLYSLVSLMEMAAGPVLAWIPFYSTFKLIIASWLVLPQFRGGIILYEKFVRPYVNATTGSAGGQLTDGERKWLGSVSPDAQDAVAEFIRQNGAVRFDELMQVEVQKVKPQENSKVEEKKEHDGSSSDSD